MVRDDEAEENKNWDFVCEVYERNRTADLCCIVSLREKRSEYVKMR